MKLNKAKKSAVGTADAVVISGAVVVVTGNNFSKSPNSVIKVLSATEVSGLISAD